MAIALRSQSAATTYGSGTNVTVTAPAGITNGDILVALIVTAIAGTPPTPALAGWTAFGTPTTVTVAGFTGQLNILWKRAASEAGNYTFTHTTASRQGWMACFSGCLASGTPLSATSNNTGTGNTSTGLGITTTAANSYLLYLAHSWGDAPGTLSPPSGMTEMLDATLLYAAWELRASAAATSDRVQNNGNAGGGSSGWAARMVELLADTGGGGTTYNDTTAETGSAAETAGGLLVTTKAIAEAAAAAETATGRIVTTKAVAETAAAAETVAGLAVSAGAVAETASAAETTTAAVVAAGVSAVAETASAVDALSGRLVISAAVAESASVVDAVVGTGPATSYSVAVIEVVAAADTLAADVVAPAPVPLPPPVTTLDATFAAFFAGAVVQQNLTDAVAYWIVTYGAVTADDVPAILALANSLLAAAIVPPMPAVQDDYSSPVPYPAGLARFPDANPTPAGWSIVTDERVVRGVVT